MNWYSKIKFKTELSFLFDLEVKSISEPLHLQPKETKESEIFAKPSLIKTAKP